METYLETGTPLEPLTQTQTNVNELFLLKPSTKIAHTIPKIEIYLNDIS